LPKYELLKIFHIPQTVPREFRACFLRLSLHRALDSEAAQQEAAEEAEEADREQERKAQPLRHVLAGLVDAGHLEAEDSLHPRRMIGCSQVSSGLCYRTSSSPNLTNHA